MYKIPIIKNKKGKVIFGEQLSDKSSELVIDSSAYLEATLKLYEQDLITENSEARMKALEREMEFIVLTNGKGLYLQDWVAGIMNKYAVDNIDIEEDSFITQEDRNKIEELESKGFKLRRTIGEKLYQSVFGIAVLEREGEQLYLIRFPSSYLLTNKHGYLNYREGEFYYSLHARREYYEKNS